MQVPSKITPDNLKNAIINIKFSSNYPIEFFNGRIYELLKLDLNYLPAVPININPREKAGPPIPELIQFASGVFTNDKIKLQVHNSNFIFTNWDKYLGWDIFFGEIKNILLKIHSSGIISSYQNIGIRYISEYVNESIFDKIKNDFRITFIDNQSSIQSTVYKSEMIYGRKRLIINIADRLQRINTNINSVEQFSLIDIDVISPVNIKNFEDLVLGINDSHNTEKEIFFGLLKDEFLNTLQPIY